MDKEVYNLEVTENIKFTCKRKASSILEIGKVKFYFYSTDNSFFQRGLGKKESTWFGIIKEYMRLSEIGDTENLNKFISNFKEKYINKKLNKEFYERLIPKMDNVELLKNLY
ncbi:hypothetical protein EII27_05735 [Fusobacterium canifelinum]|uniref:Uncharacterized protein n=1 Tax=Fusobacterium canifelinum TaxID=285729 RepID=A0A3P1UUT6_9FUSO|nr:hypothetical protein EII27_05735 [Fusobacterium canifelinum]